MADPTLLTFQDIIDHLTVWSRGGSLEAETAEVRHAALNAYRNLCLDADHPYLLKHHRVYLTGPYTTGTVGSTSGSITGATNASPIVITSTSHGLVTGDIVNIADVGGTTAANQDGWSIVRVDANSFSLTGSNGNAAYTSGGTWYNPKSLTLSGGIWPNWAKFGRIIINDTVSVIKTRVSNTVVTLEDAVYPYATIAAGESYTLYRSHYPLPDDFKAGYSMMEEDRIWCGNYIHPDEWLRLERSWNQTGGPYNWTIMADPERYGAYAVYVMGYPDAVETLDFMYYGRGRNIKLSGYESRAYAGTVSVTANTTTVTGSSSAFTSDMVGSIIRFSSDTNSYPTGLGGLNVYGDQERIASFTSTTVVTLEEGPDSTYSATKYVVSDPLDLSASLLEALQRGAEHQLAIFRGVRVEVTKKLYDEALIRARERNAISKQPYTKGGISAPPWVQWWSRGTVT